MVFLLLILVRIWHLAVVQHEAKLEEASRPQRRTVIERPDRAPIFDRNGLPLALNRVQYNASLCYAPIRAVRRVVISIEKGKKIKTYPRKEYITQLSEKLAELLHLNAREIEDIIYAKAAILGNMPYLLKENIAEESYFKLKMLEQSWPGIVADIAPRREYPQGRVAGELIGYIGPISSAEYQRVLETMQRLRAEENFQALEELERHAYSLNDLTGKMGVEASFDQQLRGERGKKIYLADTRGNFLRLLPGGEEAVPGHALRLTIDAELQAYAEQLLVEYEQAPPSMRPVDLSRQENIPPAQPWIKGGAVVVMNPKTGEILALASHPRFNPNDFIAKRPTRNRILETEAALAEIWDFRLPLVRERFNVQSGSFTEEEIALSWKNYLKLILPKQSVVVAQLNRFNRIEDAVFVQTEVDKLLSLFDSTPRKVFDRLYEEEGLDYTIAERDYFAKRLPEVSDEVRHVKSLLAPYFDPIKRNDEKLLLVDLYRLLVDYERFSPQLLARVKQFTLEDYRAVMGHFCQIEEGVKEIVHKLFEETLFQDWREEHFKNYLASKRKLERAQKRKYSRPYTDYLYEKKEELFGQLWEKFRLAWIICFLSGEGEVPFKSELCSAPFPWQDAYLCVKQQITGLSIEEQCAFFQTLRSFDTLDRPLLGYYSGIRSQREKHLAAAFYPRYGYGTARSFAFRQATVIGSIFKLVPAYEAMRQQFLRNLEEAKGCTDINPLVITDDKHRVEGKGWNVGFTLEGRAIPLFYKGGRLPRSEHAGVGRVDLERALERSSNPYFALLAGDILDDPEDLVRAAHLFSYGEKTNIRLPGEYAGMLPKDVVYDRTGLYSMAIGQHSMVGTPLQTAVMLSAIANGGQIMRPKIALDEEDEVRWELFMPTVIQRKLINGMRRVVMGEHGTARFVRQNFPLTLCERMVGKTSTAEVMERYSLDGKYGTMKAKDIWFGGILYHDKECRDPDIVVVVYLRQGNFGRLAAPYAFKIADKWDHRQKLTK